MLRKLLKHEFRATARVMIPLYLITVLLAVLTRATALWAEMVTFDGMLGRNPGDDSPVFDYRSAGGAHPRHRIVGRDGDL